MTTLGVTNISQQIQQPNSQTCVLDLSAAVEHRDWLQPKTTAESLPMIELQSNPGSLIESYHNGLDPESSPTSASGTTRRWSGKTFLACGCCFLVYMLQMVAWSGVSSRFFLHFCFGGVCLLFVGFFAFFVHEKNVFFS